MVEEIPDRDVFAVSGKIREYFRECLVIAQLPIVDEQHDGHGGELLGEGRKPEVRVCVDFRVSAQVRVAVAFFKRGAPVLANEHRQSGRVFLGDGTEDRVGLTFRRKVGALRAGLYAERKKSGDRKDNCELQLVSFRRPAA